MSNCLTKLTYTILFILSLVPLNSCTEQKEGQTASTPAAIKSFEDSINAIRNVRLYQYTYDLSNVPIADSIYKEAERLGSDNGKMVALELKMYACVTHEEHINQFLDATDEFIALALKNNEMQKYYDAVNSKVNFYVLREQYIEAMELVEQVMHLAQKTQEPEGLYIFNFLYGYIYTSRTNYGTARSYYNAALQYVENDIGRKSLLYRKLSELDCFTHNYDDALDNALKSIEFAPNELYKVFGEFQRLHAYYKAERFSDFIKEYNSSPLSTLTDPAIFPQGVQDELRIPYYICTKQWDKAIKTANRLEEHGLRNAYMFDIYKYKGDIVKALNFKERIDFERDSLQAALQVGELNQLEAKLGNSQLKLESAQLKYQNALTIGISIIVVLCIFGGFITFVNFRRKQHLKELRKKNQELAFANEQARKASEVKLIFLKNMTHEFNTPLNSIVGFSELLSNPDFPLEPDMVRDMASNIFASSVHLTDLLNNIVEVSNKLTAMDKLEEVESVLKESEKKL